MSSIKIYKFDSYKKYLQALIEASPKAGRGQYKKISEYLKVHSTLISQILSGPKDFSMEQALKVADYFNLSLVEKDCFILLVQKDKAGTVDLKNYFESKIDEHKARFQKISSRVKANKKLDENQLALYYSDWQYMAIWLASSIDKLDSINKISQKLNIDSFKVQEMVDFLVASGLCIENKGEIKMGKTRTHLDSNSKLVKRHHINWRLKAIENFETLKSDELAFSAPLSISRKDFRELKSEILDFIEIASKKVKKTNPEEVACLNIDFFKI